MNNHTGPMAIQVKKWCFYSWNQTKNIIFGREPWSSGYGRWLTFQRSWVRILAPDTGWTWHFSHWFVVKIVCLFEKTENKRKRGRGWPIFKKTKNIYLCGLSSLPMGPVWLFISCYKRAPWLRACSAVYSFNNWIKSNRFLYSER